MKILFLLVEVICTANMLILVVLLENVRALMNEKSPSLKSPKKSKAQSENDEYSLFFNIGDISRNMRKRFKLTGPRDPK